MKDAIPLVKNPLLCVVLVLAVLTLMQIESRAQSGPPQGQGSPAVVNPKSTAREQEIREGRLRSAEFNEAAENTQQKRVEEMITQMKKDFTRIQVLRNVIAHNLVALVPLEYHAISDQAGEINKRSNRLKSYMMSHRDEKETEVKKTDELGANEMTGALVRLCKLIDGFVENPALKNAATLDAKSLDKAKADKSQLDSDLLSIIELSGRIRQSAQKLEQNPQ